MANTEVVGGPNKNIVEVSAMDSDYDEGSYRKVQSILFQPGAAADYLSIKDRNSAGPELMPSTASSTDAFYRLFSGEPIRVYIDFSESTLSVGHKISIVYESGS